MRHPPKKTWASNMERLRYWRNMPFIKRGMRVQTHEGMGRVTATDGDRVHVLLDGAKHPERYHPWWKMVYYQHDGTIAKDYR